LGRGEPRHTLPDADAGLDEQRLDRVIAGQAQRHHQHECGRELQRQ
jgi:hypothetical protein